MTISDQTPLRLLPMSDHVRGKRPPVTCQFKCANACLGPECNTSDNPHFRDIASCRPLAGVPCSVSALAGAIGLASPSATPPEAGHRRAACGRTAGHRRGLPFDADRTPSTELVDEFTVPAGYTWQPIIRWGDPLFSSTPALDFEHQTPEAQAGQFGYNSDYLDIIADPSGKTGVLVNNHEYVNPSIMFPADERPRRAPPSRRHLQGRPGHVGRRAAAPQASASRGRTSSTAAAIAASRSRRCSSSPAPRPAPTS